MKQILRRLFAPLLALFFTGPAVAETELTCDPALVASYVKYEDGGEFPGIEIDGAPVTRGVYTDETEIPDENFSALCKLFSNAELMADRAKSYIVETWEDEFIGLVSDLVASNGDYLLEEMFPGSDIESVSDITKNLVEESVHVTNMMAWYTPADGQEFTVDVRFKHGGIDYLFAVRFDGSGRVTHVDTES